MKRGRRAAALALGALLVLSAAACGGGEDPAAVIQSALEKLNAAESLEADVQLELGLSVVGISVEAQGDGSLSYFSDPMKLKAEMEVSMGALGSNAMNLYAVQEGDRCATYTWNGSDWTAGSVEADELRQYDAKASMGVFLEYGEDFVRTGREEINGALADQYTGVIRGEALKEVLDTSAVTGSMEALSGELDGDGRYDELGEASVRVWVDRESGYPVRYNVDMTAVLQALMERSMKDSAGEGDMDLTGMASVDKAVVTMDCRSFNAAADFTVPEEALAAGGADGLLEPGESGMVFRLSWMEQDGERYDMGEEDAVLLTLLDDGSFRMDLYGAEEDRLEGVWTLDGLEVKLTCDGAELSGELVGPSLVLIQEGDSMGFELISEG